MQRLSEAKKINSLLDSKWFDRRWLQPVPAIANNVTAWTNIGGSLHRGGTKYNQLVEYTKCNKFTLTKLFYKIIQMVIL